MSVMGLNQGRHAALLISECQDGITNSATNPGSLAEQVAARGSIANIAALAAAFRAVIPSGVSADIALQGAATEAVGPGHDVGLAEDCTAGETAETHLTRITLHLPLIATISNAAAIRAAIGA